MGGRGSASGGASSGGGAGGSTGKEGSSGGGNSGKKVYDFRSKSLPTLSGSERQVAWANNLRKSLIDFYGRTRPGYVAKELAHTDAKYWIDNRHGMGITTTDQRAIQRSWYKK